MQNKIIHSNDLFREDGNIREFGYATTHIFKYDRAKIQNNKKQIKEWDFYMVQNQNMIYTFSIGNLTKYSYVQYSIIDLEKKTSITKRKKVLLNKKSLNAPNNPENGSWYYIKDSFYLALLSGKGNRHIKLYKKAFSRSLFNKKDLSIIFDMDSITTDSICSIKPFSKDFCFHYTQKYNCLPTDGMIIYDKQREYFSKENTLSAFSWERGVWPKTDLEYTTCMMNAYLDKKNTFGFSFRAGLGNEDNGSENMIFYNNIGHKIATVIFTQKNINTKENKHSKNNLMQDWTITDSDGRINLTFKPLLINKVKARSFTLKHKKYELYGNFSGYCILDDNTSIPIESKPGFIYLIQHRG